VVLVVLPDIGDVVLALEVVVGFDVLVGCVVTLVDDGEGVVALMDEVDRVV